MSTHDARGSVEHLAKLSREQRAQLFQRLKEKQRSERMVDEVIHPYDRNAQSFPLSFAQLRLWFLDQFEPDSAVYIIPQALRLFGPLMLEIFLQALGDMIERHETLRTTFIAIDGEPRQCIAPARPVTIPLIDLQNVCEAVSKAEVLRLADAEAHRPFNLATGPLLRLTLLRLGQEEHILLLTMHHIISDAWSGGIFMREFFTFYEAHVHGRSAQLPSLPIQYIDFTLWQHQRLQGTKLEEQLAYWQAKLADVPMLHLPIDHPRPAMQTFHGAAQSLLLSESLSSALHDLSRREGATLFMTLLTAFKVLLYRYNGQEDIVVGSLIANRNRAEIEGLIGFFVNTLVLRTDLSGSPGFRELLRREREVCLEAYAHQDLPFEQLVDALQPERNLSYSPLFQVMFTLQNTPRPSSSSAGQSSLSIQHLDTGTATSKFDLSLFLSEGPHGINIEAEYNTDLFEAETIGRMLACFRNLLEAIAANPDCQIAALPLLAEDERQQLLVEWNATRYDYPQHSCLHELIEEQVQHTPDAVALVFEGQQLTYSELNARATRLAHYLCYHYTIGPETLIGLALDRSPSLLIGLLGILKAGAAYVPLDPDYPRQRLAFVLQQTQIPVLLTQVALLERLPEHQGVTLCLDRDWPAIACDLPPVRLPRAVAGNLAYTIYTSGSTGLPKGVQISHQALVNFLCSMRDQPGANVYDTLLAVTSISFDIAGLELWLPLIVGARLVLTSREVSRDGEQLKQHLIEQAVTMMQATPTTWRLLLEVGWRSPSEMRVLCGGEALPVELAQTLSQQSALFWNMYGPTETTIWSTLQHIISVEGSVSIGRPIANTQIYLLNAHLEPVPIGAIGDLYIGGDGLSRGYFQRPEATAERFVPDPFSSTPGARLYKTGDLARYRAQGNLEFLGRNDHQVKIHGFRIELQEIEATLEQHSSVRESVVVAREDSVGESDSKRLVAYIVPQFQHQDATAQPDWQDEQVQQWQSVWDTTYSEDEADHDPAFDLSGWRSSYTHEPIPAAEMREWVDQTVERVLANKPERILEIGCGTGLLLFRLAPHCRQYCGMDFSSSVLQQVRREVERQGLSHVTLLERNANDLSGIEAGVFDTIILNSVVQYFPGVEFLIQLLEHLIRLVAPGGRIFLGDIRNHSLLEVFHTSVQVRQAEDALSLKELQHLVGSHIAQEKELTVDPAFFKAVKQRFHRVGAVDIQLKRGHAYNELTCFRYDVVLHMDTEEPPDRQPVVMDWRRSALTLALIRTMLVEAAPDFVHITGILNARLITDVKARDLLKDEGGLQDVKALREAAQNLAAEEQGVDPEEFWALGEQLAYTVGITWSASRGDRCYDVALRRKTTISSSGEDRLPLFVVPALAKILPWSAYTNNPLQVQFQQKLAPELRDYLKEKLPEYMLPSAFVVLQALPLTPNGKIDRRALPALGHSRSAIKQDYVAPRTQTEEALAAIWRELLGIERIGIHDNFFDLGGNSLLIIRMVAKANKAGLAITTRQVFKHQTIAQLAVEVGMAAIIAEQSPISGLAPSTPGQRFVLASSVHNPQYFNLAYFVEFQHPLNPAHLQRVIQELTVYHDALRICRAPQDATLPLFITAPSSDPPFLRVDLSNLSDQQEMQVVTHILKALQMSLELYAGPLFKVVLFEDSPTEPCALLLLGHYLVADVESWQILIGDLLSWYQQLTEKGSIAFPPRPTSFKQWAERLHEYAQSTALQEFPYWFARVNQQVMPLPRDYPEGLNIIESSRSVEMQLSAEETNILLQAVLKQQDVQMDAILIMAIAWAFRQWSGHRSLLVRLFTHGREPLFEDMDISRTVGALATDFPVYVDITTALDEVEALQLVKAQLKNIPHHGIGYGILRELGRSSEAEMLRATPEPEVVVNYIGEGFSEAPRSKITVHGPITAHYLDTQSDRTYTFQITGRVLDGRFHTQWDYSEQLHRRPTVELVARSALQAVRALITRVGAGIEHGE